MVKKQLLKLSILCIFTFVVKNSFGQQLHHQTLSAQGGTNILKSGMIVRHTVGQQSAIGNATVSKLSVQQGFQQSMFSQVFPIYSVNTVATTVYPNPFAGLININFSKSITGEMSIALYNLFGVMVYQEVKQDPVLSISFNFGQLPSGSYVLHLTAKNYVYSKILIKQ